MSADVSWNAWSKNSQLEAEVSTADGSEVSTADGCSSLEDKGALMAAAAFTAKRPFEAWTLQHEPSREKTEDNEDGEDDDGIEDQPRTQLGLADLLIGLRHAESRGARPLGWKQRRRPCRQGPPIIEAAPDSSDSSADDLPDKPVSSKSWHFTNFVTGVMQAEKAAARPRRRPQKHKTPNIPIVVPPSPASIGIDDEESRYEHSEDSRFEHGEDSRPVLGLGGLLLEAIRAESRGARPLKRRSFRPKCKQVAEAAICVSVVEPDSSDDG